MKCRRDSAPTVSSQATAACSGEIDAQRWRTPENQPQIQVTIQRPNVMIVYKTSSTHMVGAVIASHLYRYNQNRISPKSIRTLKGVTSRPLSFLGRLLALAALFTRLFRLVLLPTVVFLHSGVDDLELALDPGRSAHPFAGAALGHHIRQLFFLRLQQSSSAVHSTNSDVIITTLPKVTS